MTQSHSIDFESDIVSLLINIYEAAGNAAALQYAGSELVNTIQSYKDNDLYSQSRDIIQTLKRYYSNSFTDWEKQHSINLFLGNFIPASKTHFLWELESDSMLHNKTSRPENILLSNFNWWESPLQTWNKNLAPKILTEKELFKIYQSYFQDYYRPNKLTHFDIFLRERYNQIYRPVRKSATSDT